MQIKYIVIHCADTPNDKEFTAADIHDWHKQRGWDGIGYNYVIRRSGLREHGRPEYWQGSHVRGHNHESIGICLIGRDKFTDEQMIELADLVREIEGRHPQAEAIGHYELDPHKTCPNFDVREWRRGI